MWPWISAGLRSLMLVGLVQHPRTDVRAVPSMMLPAIQSLKSPSNTSHTFLTAGFWAWLAYFLATSQDAEIEQSLSQLPSPSLQYIATQVSKVSANGSLATCIQHTFYVSNRSKKRRRDFEEINIELPPVSSSLASEPLVRPPGIGSPSSPPESNPSSPSLEPNPPKRPCLDPSQQSLDRQLDTTWGVISYTIDADLLQQGGVSDIGIAKHNTIRELPTFELIQQYERAYPEAKNLPFVFPHVLSTMIVKRDDHASLTISVPPDPRGCRLVLYICAEAVRYNAFHLFGVRISVRNQQRVVISNSGVTIAILCSIGLKETALTWDTDFGKLVTEGVQLSPMRLDEASKGAILTKCLSIEIPGNAGCPARLCLMIQPGRLIQIASQLWQP